MRTNEPHSEASLQASIRAEMARRGRTQRDLGALLGMSQPTVSGRMTGRTDFTITELRAVARWLGVPLTALLGDEAA